MTATTPFSFAGGQTHEITPTSGSISASIDVIFTPSTTAQTHTSAITIRGGGLPPGAEIALTGVSVPPLAEVNGSLEIQYIEQLNLVRNDLDGDYKLTRNLDFTSDGSYASGAVNLAYRPQKTDGTAATTGADIAAATNPGFTPIGDGTTGFTGTFDGGGFAINSLYINSKAIAIHAGLFGVTGADSKIRNLGLLNAYVKGNSTVGGLVGNNNTGSTITNCYITGTVSGSTFVGGLVGNNSISSGISNCYAIATVSGTGAGIGGLVGSSSGNSIITNCYATGDVSGNSEVGGLVGFNNSLVLNCYATGTITGTGTNGLVGSPNLSSVITNSFFKANASNTNTGARTESDLQMLTATSASWDEKDWDFGDNTKFPTLRSYEGTEDNQVQGFVICNQPTDYVSCDTEAIALHSISIDFGEVAVATTRQLVIVGRNLNGAVTLTALTAPFAYEGQAVGQTLTLTPNSNKSINASIPITLTPTADYQTHSSMITISGGGLSPNVEIALTGVSVPALADGDGNGLLEIKYIEQLNVVRNDLTIDYELARHLDFANDNHYSSGVVNDAYIPDTGIATTGTNAGFPPIGDGDDQFAGTFEGNGFTISKLYINITIPDSFIYAGLFGALSSESMVQNIGVLDVYVQAEGTSRGSVYAGGLVGLNAGTIRNSYATGTATATGSNVNVGGLVGFSFSSSTTITNCYATATATGTGTGGGTVRTGGLVGLNNDGIISNCYATGTSSGGGLVGFGGGNNKITNCYWDTETTGQTTSSGGGTTDRTTAEMKELTGASTTWNAFDWDFGTNNQYPALRSYEKEGSNPQTQGALLCGQPAPRADCSTSTPIFLGDAINFGGSSYCYHSSASNHR